MQKKVFTLEDIALLTQTKLVGNPYHLIYNVSDLENATSEDASFLANPRYKTEMLKSQAGVIFIDESTSCLDGKNYLIAANPSLAFQKLLNAFHEARPPSGFTGIHPTAIVHPSVQVGQNVTLGPYVVIDEGASIGSHTFIGTGTYVGVQTVIGNHCFIHPRVVIREKCVIGNRVIIQPGAVIGSCGFGYITDKQGKHTKLDQVGNVVVEDDVEIGANTTIDRARFKSTLVGRGSKLDNLVQIAHNVKIGTDNLFAAQVGIAGSTSTDENVVLGGQAAVAGHLHICKHVLVAGKSGVTKSLMNSGKYGGFPATPLAKHNRIEVLLRHIELYVEQIKTLNSRLQALEERIGK